QKINAYNRTYGLPVVAADDIFGVKTAAAVRAFQKAHGLRETGVADASTWKALDAQSPPTPSLASGDDGEHVHRLQLLLNTYAREHGLSRVATDGLYGHETRAAVRTVQRAANLPETGVADRAVWHALDSGMTRPAPAPAPAPTEPA